MKQVIVRGSENPMIVDDEDFEEINKYKWICRKKGMNRYAASSGIFDGHRRTVRAHRLIMRVSDPMVLVDHINHNGLDNRKENLRLCTNQQNMFNSGKYLVTKYSKYKGVRQRIRKKGIMWFAEITMGGKKKYSKQYKTESEAALAYNEMANRLFGEFAFPNAVDG